MKNWEVVKKKISEMNEKEFIEFANEQITCLKAREVIGYKGMDCDNCKYFCKYPDCECSFLQDEYQEPKQEKWIVHRTLRTKGIEVYIVEKGFANYRVETLSGITYHSSHIKEKAVKVNDLHSATFVRDKLNETRKGKQYLWVVSKEEE